jgi:antiviral helicase SKI2
MERHLKSRMLDVISQLGDLVSEWTSYNRVPEVDWARMRLFDFQELLSRRNTLVQRLDSLACVLCKEFEQHVCPPMFSFLVGLTHVFSTKPCT